MFITYILILIVFLFMYINDPNIYLKNLREKDIDKINSKK